MNEKYILLTINHSAVMSTFISVQRFGTTWVNRSVVLYILEVWGLVDVDRTGPYSPYYTDDQDRVSITELGKRCEAWLDTVRGVGTIIIPLDESHE